MTNQIPEEIINHIFGFVPRDRDMASPTADIMSKIILDVACTQIGGTDSDEEESEEESEEGYDPFDGSFPRWFFRYCKYTCRSFVGDDGVEYVVW